ncbi:SipW-dependent-type signal peptide-containing protein [Paeniglutamicibacter sulfureus]|uniref:SipW-dependent-type signal peptide-containing protein n=1 Tax=Paeniglutamicibacter sulfureus TaxID=43666 RepID=UPI00266613BB|nr:SipW-dependent-type signal peptide-containing protein [Paeniglutamicibacter sulfureus]MDO2934786.1 SipW-dependent-type signal peptide-containing protein [Paeniglutamicibacter sulfureus]
MRLFMLRERGHRLIRLRAVLAGGLVLGVGATATLAAWTDEEHSAGSFKAGTFSIVGSTNGTDFSDHPAASGASLAFSLPAAAMVPGTTVYALYSVKTAKTPVPSVAGSVHLTADAANFSGLGNYLHYGVKAITQTTCDAITFAHPTSIVVVDSGSKLNTGADVGIALAANGDSTVNYCFAVTLPADASNEAQGAALTARWTFAATTDPAGN